MSPDMLMLLLLVLGAGNELRLHFNSTRRCSVGANIVNNRHYTTITPSASFDQDVRCKEMYLTVRTQSGISTTIEYAVFAEITSITGSEFYSLTGSR